MFIRIDLITEGPDTVVRIAGRLSGTAVAELKRTCRPIRGPFAIDLSDLVFADNEGIDAISDLAAEGTRIHNASPYVQLLLDKAPSRRSALTAPESQTSPSN